MKVKWLLIPFFGILALIFIIIIIVRIANGPDEKKTTNPANTNAPVTSTSTSTVRDKDEKLDLVTVTAEDQIYHNGQQAAAGIPSGTVSDPDFPGLSVYWVRNSLSGTGQDTCSLYDNTTKQIYFSYYIESGQIGDPHQGKTYYKNSAVSKADATGLIDSLCFK